MYDLGYHPASELRPNFYQRTQHISSFTLCLNCPCKDLCKCTTDSLSLFSGHEASSSDRPTAMSHDRGQEDRLSYTHSIPMVTEAFLFCTQNHWRSACEYLGDYNADTHGSRHLGSKVRKTVISANHMTTELGFPAEFLMVKFGFCSHSKEVVRTSQGWDRAGNYTRPLQFQLGA